MPNFQDDTVKINDGIDSIESPVLPFDQLFNDGLGDLIGVLDTNGQLRREYDYKNHILTRHRNAGGLIVQYEYDDYSTKGKFISQLTNMGQVWLFDYRDGETLVTDPLQRVIRYQYNENKQFTGFVDANGHKTTATLDKTVHPLVITTPGGKQIRYAYDQYGKVTSVTDAVRGRTTAFDYDPNDEFLQITDAQGHITKHYMMTEGYWQQYKIALAESVGWNTIGQDY